MLNFLCHYRQLLFALCSLCGQLKRYLGTFICETCRELCAACRLWPVDTLVEPGNIEKRTWSNFFIKSTISWRAAIDKSINIFLYLLFHTNRATANLAHAKWGSAKAFFGANEALTAVRTLNLIWLRRHTVLRINKSPTSLTLWSKRSSTKNFTVCACLLFWERAHYAMMTLACPGETRVPPFFVVECGGEGSLNVKHLCRNKYFHVPLQANSGAC